jgi:5-methylcytosine-specific restriction endonuclease McrA
MTTICVEPNCWRDAVHRGRCALHQTARTGRPRGSTRAWRKLRTRVLRRAHHRCERPGCARPAIHVHHRHPIGQGGPNLPSPDQLEALCTEHHNLEHPHGR